MDWTKQCEAHELPLVLEIVFLSSGYMSFHLNLYFDHEVLLVIYKYFVLPSTFLEFLLKTKCEDTICWHFGHMIGQK